MPQKNQQQAEFYQLSSSQINSTHHEVMDTHFDSQHINSLTPLQNQLLTHQDNIAGSSAQNITQQPYHQHNLYFQPGTSQVTSVQTQQHNVPEPASNNNRTNEWTIVNNKKRPWHSSDSDTTPTNVEKRSYWLSTSVETPKIDFNPSTQTTLQKKDIPQCTRCQTHGHTKNYCTRIPQCVKCAGKHLTEQCNWKDRSNQVKCCNCGGNHPASYKGCKIRKQLINKMFPKLRERITHSTYTRPSEVQPGKTYAQVSSTSHHVTYHSQQDILTTSNESSSTSQKIENMMMQLMTSMNTMINLLNTVISKLR
ncbi:hypothetical protein KPH14_010935 [Odynerus spinipes]|uniref:Uncharacterized protein n=1 Tax=Odynerus spinipes TaxID=1348599 RepID=A0AAD9RG28_9HYME|nr:hypothetical protein KPH14_010935 [Odynerus spinipes]